MKDTKLLTINQLFDSIGIIQKGIEKVYYYLLINRRIDNLKEVCNQFNLSLKRCYKICSCLKKMGLVQIYGRPMEIHVVNPIFTPWRNIIQKKIEELQNKFQEKKEKIETSFEEFVGDYQLEVLRIQSNPL